MMARKKSPVRVEPPRWVFILLLSALALSFLFATVFTWLNRTVVSQNFFSATISNELKKEENRLALSRAIVDATLEDRPLVRQLAGDQAIRFVSAVLGSDMSARVVDGVVEKSYAFLTRPHREDVVINLSAIRQPIAALVTVAQNQLNNERLDAFDISSVPTEVVLVQEEQWPDYSPLVRVSLLAEPLLWMLTAGLAITYLAVGRKAYARRVYTLGVVLLSVVLFGLIMAPFLPPVLSTLSQSIQLGLIIENIAKAFLGPLVRQLIASGLLILLALALFRSRRWWQRVYVLTRKKIALSASRS